MVKRGRTLSSRSNSKMLSALSLSLQAHNFTLHRPSDHKQSSTLYKGAMLKAILTQTSKQRCYSWNRQLISCQKRTSHRWWAWKGMMSVWSYRKLSHREPKQLPGPIQGTAWRKQKKKLMWSWRYRKGHRSLHQIYEAVNAVWRVHLDSMTAHINSRKEPLKGTI